MQEIKCPKCGKLLMYVSPGATGDIFPYCKRCKKNHKVTLPVTLPIATNTPTAQTPKQSLNCHTSI